MASSVININSSRRATDSAHYAAIAETQHGLTLSGLLARCLLVKADIADPSFKASDAATAGMIAEEEGLISAIATMPPQNLHDVRRKVELYPQTFDEDGQPTKVSSMLFAAIISDLRLLEARI